MWRGKSEDEKGKEDGQRCHRCYQLRLKATYEMAKERNLDFFCSTLSVSPYKRADVLNEIGMNLSDKQDGVLYLPNDFKKKDGYLSTIKLSKELSLYKQYEA